MRRSAMCVIGFGFLAFFLLNCPLAGQANVATAHARLASQPPAVLNFAPAVTYNAGGFFALSIAVADVNGDGKSDLVVADCGSSVNCVTGTVSVLLGNGDGTFQPAVNYSSGGDTALSIAIADVNADGKPDVVVTNSCADSNCANGTVSVLLGNGDGTFQAPVTYSSGGVNAFTVVVADVNGDGKPDLVVANGFSISSSSNGVVGILLGNGDGTFQPVTTVGSGGYQTYSAAVADVNGDGKPDLISSNFCASNGVDTCTNGTVGVLLGNGDGTFQPAVSYSSGGLGAGLVIVVDLNGDGKPDLAAVNGSDTVGILLGNGDGTFESAVAYGPGTLNAASFALADVNGDGKLDVIIATACGQASNCNGTTGTAQVLLGNGDGTFQSAATYGSGGYHTNFIAAADINGDGLPDLFLVNQCNISPTDCADGSIGVLINTSAFGTTTTLTSSLNPAASGQAITLTATVTPAAGSGIPAGTVTFLSGSSTLGTATLSGGTATWSASGLTVGNDSITVAYSGNSHFAASSSSPLVQVVNATPFSAAPSGSSSATVTAGQAATFSVSFTPGTASSQTVSLSCSGGPPASTCMVSPSTIGLSGTTAASAKVTVQTTANGAAVVRHPGPFANFGGGPIPSPSSTSPQPGIVVVLGLALVVVVCVGRRRSVVLAGMLLALLLLAGCGGSSGGPSGTRPGTYTVTVTAQSGNFSQQVNLKVTVQ